MKVSEITVETVKQYSRIDGDADDTLISTIIFAAKEYVKSYTGLTSEDIDLLDDLPIAVLALAADMYDLRQSSVSGTVSANPAVKQILDSHSMNLV